MISKHILLTNQLFLHTAKYKKQFYFKQFRLVIVQFFVYTQLNVKTVLFENIPFSISTQFKRQTVLFDP